MKTYNFNNISITLNNAGQIVSIDGIEPSAEDMAHYAAVISLALAEDAATIVHDDEPVNTITIQRKATPWNDPSRQFNHK